MASNFARCAALLSFRKRKDRSGVETYKGCRIATSASSNKSVFPFVMMAIQSIGFDYECESCDEREKPEGLDAPPDAFCTVERIVGLAVRDGLALPFLLSRNAGPASGVYSGRVQTLQCVHPKCR